MKPSVKFSWRLSVFVLAFTFSAVHLFAQHKSPLVSFTVSVKDTASHLYHVSFRCEGFHQPAITFKMPNWTPGYYQLMNYADKTENFSAKDQTGKELEWEKASSNSWKVQTGKATAIILSYDIKADLSFVAANYLDGSRGYISPAGVFLYPEGFLNAPVSITIEPIPSWTKMATGLEAVKNKSNTFIAPDYDVLYDSPLLTGKLEDFPSFTVKGIPHYFTAYKPGDFDKAGFMDDLKKIVIAASEIIGDIPYSHYTFLAIGPGGGGIEHLNSTSIAFSGNGLDTKEGKNRMYSFLAHEYFHHYNVKRIRPVELGPFDYDKGSRTKMLWLSEGITVYYEYLILKRAGLMRDDELFETFSSSIKEYESKPGRYFQTPAEASYNTWEEGPFGRTGDELNKTISPYDKGPALGLLLDFKIRHETKNKKSLDDLMRVLYNKYYKRLKRGFTEEEFRKESETVAGASLADFFDYIYTLKTVDYPEYFKYAGLSIDTASNDVPGAWLGTSVKDRNDSLFIQNTEWKSPAWEAGLRPRKIILNINGRKADAKTFNEIISSAKPGDKIKILFTTSSGEKEAEITLSQRKEKSFSVNRISNPNPLQVALLKSWLGNK